MSVHRQLSQQNTEKYGMIGEYNRLDGLREQAISEALGKCERGEAFTVDLINQYTEKINQLAQKHQLPSRKSVTIEMVQKFVHHK